VQKEQQLFHSKEQQASKGTNCSGKGTTIVPFKGTIGTQKEQQLFRSKEQLFRSKEQQARKRNNNC
jgi:hypothetical protein